MSIKPDLPANDNPRSCPARPKAPIPAVKPDLAALDMHRVPMADGLELRELTVPELYAQAFDIGEDDPAQSAALIVADQLTLIGAALEAELPPSIPMLERLFYRAASFARLAAELHRRQRAALLGALAEGGSR